MHTIRVAGTALVVVAALSLAGCGDDAPAGKDTGATVSGTGRCTLSDLRVTVADGEGAAGSTYYAVRLTNTSKHPCRTGGFGGVSLVGGGRPIGAPADRVDKTKLRVVTLRPGKSAEATLQVSQAGNYPTGRCRPVEAQGFRVYPPDETRSAFVRRPSPACRNAAVHLLRLSPYQPAG